MSGLLTVWVAVSLSPELEMWDIVGVAHSQQSAQEMCRRDCNSMGGKLDRWEQVARTGQQAFQDAYESRPVADTYWRVEQYLVFA